MKILIAFGTRPEFIKIKSLIDKIRQSKIPLEILFTGQQTDIAGGEYTRKISISESSNRLDAIVTSCLNNDEIFKNITHVIVQGDTSTALGIALGAFHRQIKIIHLEAGLRTYQKNPYPEEMNRNLIDKLADVYFCPTSDNAANLIKEGYKVDGIHITGNTGLDLLAGMKFSYNDEVIVTMHRRENHALMKEWFEKINELAKNNPDLKFTLPIHPNPNVSKYKYILTHVNVIAPLPYEKMIEAVSKCRFLITDSGGLQEEAAFFNKKAIVCRDCTERGEVLDTHSFLCSHPSKLSALFESTRANWIPIKHYCPYTLSTGNASEKITEILLKIRDTKIGSLV